MIPFRATPLHLALLFAFLSPLIASGPLSSPAFAQHYKLGVPEPTRVTAEPTRIVTDTTPASATQRADRPDSGFPALRAEAANSDRSAADDSATNRLAGPAITVTSSLAVVLGLFAALIWFTRRFGSRGHGGGVIPKEVVHSLGTTAINPKTQVTLLRCGNRILVLAQTASGIDRLAEITDPEEIRQLTARCLGDSGRNFASTLQLFEQEPAHPGFTGTPSKRLFTTA